MCGDGAHITVLYLSAQSEQQIALAAIHADDLARSWPDPLHGVVGGNVHTFDGPDYDVHVRKVELHNISVFREELIRRLEADGIDTTQKHPEYTPHVTIAYAPKGHPAPGDAEPVSFESSKLEFWMGPDHKIDMHIGPVEMQKAAAGSQLAGHTYTSRKPKPGGGWIYSYGEDRREERDKEEEQAANRRRRADEKEVQGSREHGRKQQEAGETLTEEANVERVQNMARGALLAHIMESGKDTYDEDGREVPKSAHRPDELLGGKNLRSRKMAELFAKTIKNATVQMTIFPNSPITYFYLAQNGVPANPDSSPASPFFGVGPDGWREEEESVQV